MSTLVNSEPSLLFVGASQKEALVMLRELQQAGFQPVWTRVTTIDSFTEALTQDNWQFVVLYDRPAFRTPGFSNYLNFLPDETKTILVLTSESEKGPSVPVLPSVCATIELYQPARLVRIVKEQSLFHPTNAEQDVFETLDLTVNPIHSPETFDPPVGFDNYKLLFDQAADGIFVLNERGEILDVNQRGCRMFGYTHGDFVGMRIESLISEQTPDQGTIDWNDIETGSAKVIERQAQHRSGMLLEVEFSLKSLTDGTILCMVRDISERKREQHGLEVKLELERFVAAIASRFILHSQENFAHQIVDTLAELCQFVQVDKACIYDFDKQTETVNAIYEWHSEGTEPISGFVPEARVGKFKWFMKCMRRMKTVKVTDLSDLPSEAEPERDFLSGNSPSNSFCVVPMAMGSSVIGVLALVNQAERHWSDESVDLFEAIAAILSNALSRKKIEDLRIASQMEMGERQTRLDLAVMGSNGGVWEFILNQENLREMPDNYYISPELKAMIGFAEDEFPNSHAAWEARIIEEDRDKLMAAGERYMNGETEIFEVEYRIRHKDESIRWIHSRGKVHKTDDGKVRASGVDWDVTERKIVEKALQESEERYRSLVEFSPIPIAVFTQGKIQFMNPAATEVLAGRTLSDFEGKSIRDLVAEEFHQLLLEELDVADKGLFRLKMVREDGQTIDVEMAATPVDYLDEPATQVVFTDITRRLQVEAELEKSADTLKATLDNAPDFVANVGLDGTLRFLNRTTVPGFVAKKSSKSIFDCAPKEMHASIQEALRKVSGERQPHEFEIKVGVADGGERWYLTRVGPVVSAGEVISLTLCATDVTKAKLHADVLQKSEERYRSLVESSPVPITVQMKDQILFMNPAAIQVLAGQSFSDFEGKGIQDFVQPEFLAPLNEGLKLRDGALFRVKLVRSDKQVIDVEITATPVNYLAEPATQVVLNDITKRLKVEAELEKSADTLKAILDNTPDFVANVGLDGTLWFANRTNVPGFKVKPSTKSIFQCAPATMHAEVREALRIVTEEKQPYEFETKATVAGAEVWYLTRIGPVVSVGEVISLVLCATDVTKTQIHAEVLRKSEERFELVVKGSNDGFWDWGDITQDQMWWSGRMWALLGFKEKELEPGISLLKKLTHPEDLARFEGAIERHLEQTLPLDTELRIRTQHDEYRWFRLRGFAIRDQKNIPLRMSGSLLDITERKNAERAILASDFNLRKAQELANVGSFEWDFKTGKVISSDQMKKIIGQNMDGTFDFKHFVDKVIHPEDRPRIRKAIEETLSKNKSMSSEFRIVLPKGQVKTLYADGEFIFDEKRTIQKMIGFVQDITARKEGEEAVKRSEERLRALLENSSDAILLYSREGRIIYQSPSMAHIFGYLPDELVGRKGLDLVYPDDKGAARQIVDECKKKRGGRSRGSFRMSCKDGSYKWIEAICSNLTDQPGVGALVLNLRDVTENKQAEDELRWTLEFEELIAKTTTALVGAEVSELEGEFVKCLEALCRFLQTDRAYIAVFHPQEAEVQHVYEWDEENVPPVADMIRSEVFHESSWFFGQALRTKSTLICKLEDIPAYAPMARETFRNLKIKSALLLPLLDASTVIGLMVFHAIEKEIDWDDDMVIQLQLVAQNFANTLIRKRFESDLRDSLNEKEILLKEIHHRVKNNLQVISSLLNLQSRYTNDEESVEIFKESQSRIRSMALIHERLYLSGDLSRIDFEDYVKHLVSHLFRAYNIQASRITVSYDLEDISLGIDIAIPCGLIVHELVSNALKHAFSGSKKGHIKILLKKSESDSGDKGYRLSVADNGTGLPLEKEQDGADSLGLRLVNMLVSQLQGELTIDTDEGTRFEIAFEL
jgi:PAS domain S-box-containing protein